MKYLKHLFLIILVAMLLTGCGLYDSPFFEGYSAQTLVIGAVTILITISQALFPKISLMQILKVYLPWLQGELAYWITMASLFGLSFLALWVSGEFDPSVKITLDQIVILYGILLSISQAAYQRLKNSSRSMIP